MILLGSDDRSASVYVAGRDLDTSLWMVENNRHLIQWLRNLFESGGDPIRCESWPWRVGLEVLD
jgi:hypothetical protein